MSNKKEVKKVSDEFDPTKLDGSVVPTGQSDDEANPPAFAHVPSGREISDTARNMFGTELSDTLIKKIVSESEEVAHSTRKILQEHMRIGGNFAHMMAAVQNQKVAELGDTATVRNRARQLVYDYLERLFRRSHSSVKLYIRCYEKFSTNAGAIAVLTYSDMSLLVADGIGDDVIDMVIDARQNDPTLSKRNMEKLIKDYRQAREQIAERDTRIELVSNELSNVAGQLDQAQLDNQRLAEEAERLRSQIERDKENVSSTLVNLADVNRQMSVLHQQIGTLEEELENRSRQLADASVKVETKEVAVPTTPEGYRNLQEAMESKLAELKGVSTELEQKRAESLQLEEQVASQRATVEANETMEKAMSGLVQRFGTFVQEYHSAQLLITAGGSPTRYANLFGALADLVGKFHTELLAATRVA
jgi:DNA repair exonuclease SbcCD ATPase subunit